MSSRKTSKNKAKKIQLPPNALEYCPQYETFDTDARREIKTRFRDHVTSRRNTLIQCADPAINDINNPKLGLQFRNCPVYQDDDEIINNAFITIDNKINTWNGVQFSKNFKDKYEKTGNKMDRKKFNTIANNHQDQTSWKVSGNKFFAPYIAKAKQHLYNYCQCIINITDAERTEIFDFACISYVVSLLNATIKFHRTKPKPLIRHKTLVKSSGIHIELQQLYGKLKITSFIASAKKKRKAIDGKNTIQSKAFHAKLVNCCNTLYREQKRKVFELCGVSLENISIDDENENNDDFKNDKPDVWPEELQDSTDEKDEDSDTYKPYKPSPSTCESTERTFQEIDPHEYGVRGDIGQDLTNERRDYRERRRQQIHNNIQSQNNILVMDENINYNHNMYPQYQYIQPPMEESIICQQLQQENDRLKMHKYFLLQELKAMDRNQYNAIPVPYTYAYPYVNQAPLQIPPMPPVSHVEFEPQMIMRQNSGNSMDISMISPPIPSDIMDISNIPQ